MDLLLSQTHPVYLPLLQRYAAALRSRNALLKHPAPDPAALEGFTRQLIEAGARVDEVPPRPCCRAFCPWPKRPTSAWPVPANNSRWNTNPPSATTSPSNWPATAPAKGPFAPTLIGPHRDELQLRLDGKSAAKYASEGQKRSIAIALKMAQAEYLTALHGAPPVLLIDDIMGELDARRRAGFLPLLSRAQHARSQVFMTCTQESWPQELGRDLRRWEVSGGTLRERRQFLTRNAANFPACNSRWEP